MNVKLDLVRRVEDFYCLISSHCVRRWRDSQKKKRVFFFVDVQVQVSNNTFILSVHVFLLFCRPACILFSDVVWRL